MADSGGGAACGPFYHLTVTGDLTSKKSWHSTTLPYHNALAKEPICEISHYDTHPMTVDNMFSFPVHDTSNQDLDKEDWIRKKLKLN